VEQGKLTEDLEGLVHRRGFWGGGGTGVSSGLPSGTRQDVSAAYATEPQGVGSLPIEGYVTMRGAASVPAFPFPSNWAASTRVCAPVIPGSAHAASGMAAAGVEAAAESDSEAIRGAKAGDGWRYTNVGAGNPVPPIDVCTGRNSASWPGKQGIDTEDPTKYFTVAPTTAATTASTAPGPTLSSPVTMGDNTRRGEEGRREMGIERSVGGAIDTRAVATGSSSAASTSSSGDMTDELQRRAERVEEELVVANKCLRQVSRDVRWQVKPSSTTTTNTAAAAMPTPPVDLPSDQPLWARGGDKRTPGGAVIRGRGRRSRRSRRHCHPTVADFYASGVSGSSGESGAHHTSWRSLPPATRTRAVVRPRSATPDGPGRRRSG
ncbi:unnamed protein product, partial [Discosporangium mesarthrocarpum]